MIGNDSKGIVKPISKTGDVSGGNYIEVESDGTSVKRGDATVYDDMLNNASSFVTEGDRPPIMKYFANDGQGTPDNARAFDGVDDYGEIDQPVINPTSYSLNIWIKPDDLEGQIIYIPDFVDFYFSGGSPTVVWDGLTTQNASITLSQLAWSMLTITAEDIGTKVNVKMYINGVLNKETERTGNLGTASGIILLAKYTSGWFNKSVYDEMSDYQIALTQANIDDLYNNGLPDGVIPAGILANCLSYYKFNEASGSTVVNEIVHAPVRPITLYTSAGTPGIVEVVNGIVGDTGSKGIALPHWSPDRITEVHLTAQTSHSRKDFTDFIQHVHGIKPIDDTGWVCFALEYATVGILGILGNTQTIRAYIRLFGSGLFHEHCLTEFTDVMDGSSLGLSSTLIGRMYRDTEWEDTNDGQLVDDYVNGGQVTFEKYNHDIILLASDAHLEKDTEGSREPYSK